MRAAFSIIYLILVFSGILWPQDNGALVFSSGVFNVLDVHTAGMGSLEYHFSDGKDRINPLSGLIFTTNLDLFLYVGANYLFSLSDNFGFTLSFAPGFYYNNRKDDLGYFIEFSSGLELFYLRRDKSRIALSLNHISNGRLSSYNPGTETVRISYYMPLGEK